MSESITLYSFADFDRSARVRWMLNELGLPFEEKRLNYEKAEHRSDEFLAMNPFSRVPALNWHGRCMIESGAIVGFLADTHPAKELAPAIDSAERAEYLQWSYFACSSLEDAMMPVLAAKVFKRQVANLPEALAAGNRKRSSSARSISSISSSSKNSTRWEARSPRPTFCSATRSASRSASPT